MAKKGRRSERGERLHAVRLLESGVSAAEIAEVLQVGVSTVHKWRKVYRQEGSGGLSTKSASGRPTYLTDAQMVQLYTFVVGKDPRLYGLGFALWTRRTVGELIYQKFGKRLSLVTVGRVLKKLGLSAQKPTYQAHQQAPEAVLAWREVTYPKIRADATRAGARIFFADEAGVRTDHHAGTTWAPVGRTPVVQATGERHSVQMISAVSPRGELHFQTFTGRMNSDTFITYLRALLSDVEGPIFLIVDGASAHTSKKTQDFVTSTHGRLSLYFLPPYSPQLNPDEWVWNNVKNTQIARIVPQNQEHLRQIAHDALNRLKNTPNIVRGFFRDPNLAYITH